MSFIAAHRLLRWPLRLALAACCGAGSAGAAPAAPDRPVEVHHRVKPDEGSTMPPPAVLTLDACGGAYDARLIGLLVAERIPATLFVTRRWLDRNPAAVAELLRHPELFEFENHGASHVPALLGSGRRLYGMPGQADLAHLHLEVAGAARQIESFSGRAPLYFRGAGAAYDLQGMRAVHDLGYQIAGFSVNADGGATLSSAAVAARLRGMRPGDVVIAHMNKPDGGTARGLADALPALRARGIRFVKLSQVQLVRAP